jgi:exosortase/archaeosortase family protein
MDPETKAHSEEAAETRRARRNTALFVLIFVVIVVSLLAGYRYAKEANANHWYLFYVAKHTSAVLDKIGYSSEMEHLSSSRRDPREVRASLAAWRRGEEDAAPGDIEAVSDAPLSAEELWEYRFERHRRIDSDNTIGPSVSFIWRPGIRVRLYEARKALDALSGGGRTDTESREKIAALNAEIAALNAQAAELSNTPEDRIRGRGYVFNFIVVPECGAIEVMAIFVAAVLAFPARWWKRLIGVLLGVPIMYGVNIFRLSCLGVIGALDTEGRYFDFAHHYVWQAIYIVFVVAVWMAWIEYVVKFREEHGEDTKSPLAGVLLFCLRFILFAVCFQALWWYAIPWYGWFLVQVSGIILVLLGIPIEAGYIESLGELPLNTDASLVFHIGGLKRALPIALLVTNLPPYIALVLATGGHAFWKRLRILLYGCGILVSGHIFYIVILVKYQARLQEAQEIFYAIILFYLTLPFLLWIVFAYREKIIRFFSGTAEKGKERKPETSVQAGGPENGGSAG